VDDAAVFRFLEFCSVSRSFPAGKYLTHETRTTLSKILEEGNAPFDELDKSMRACYEKGWIHRVFNRRDTMDLVVLPSRLHEK
jgi:hypothetical protein